MVLLLCLGFGLVAYFGLRNFTRLALSRSRSQLFSVGVGIVLLVIAFQINDWSRTSRAALNGEDFIAAQPRLRRQERRRLTMPL